MHRVFIWLLFDHDSRVYSFVTFLAGIVGLEELQSGPWREIGVQSRIYDLEFSVSCGWELQSTFPVSFALRVPVWWGFLFELLNWRGYVVMAGQGILEFVVGKFHFGPGVSICWWRRVPGLSFDPAGRESRTLCV